MKTARGVEEIRLTVEKMTKGHNSSENQLLFLPAVHNLGEISSSDHANNSWKVLTSLENGKTSCGDKIVSMDGLMDTRANITILLYY